jgi:hypothetical protein
MSPPTLSSMTGYAPHRKKRESLPIRSHAPCLHNTYAGGAPRTRTFDGRENVFRTNLIWIAMLENSYALGV